MVGEGRLSVPEEFDRKEIEIARRGERAMRE
jgi:hypothetical protein